MALSSSYILVHIDSTTFFEARASQVVMVGLIDLLNIRKFGQFIKKYLILIVYS